MLTAPRSCLAEVRGGRVHPVAQGHAVPLRSGEARELPDDGALVAAELTDDGARIVEVLAAPGTARHALLRRLADEGLEPFFAPELEAEAARRAASPLEPELELRDLEHVPFVTVDGRGTRDLNQALWVEATADGGHRALYAIADAATAVPRGGALFEEALRRGASLYLPGFSVPMLPRSLSEGAVSLNAGVVRRALVFDLRLDAAGACVTAELFQAKVRSRRQLAFDEVQSLYDGQARGPVAADAAVSASLEALRGFGRARIARAEAKHVVRCRREEITLTGPFDGSSSAELRAVRQARDEVEAYNEQLSLLCNHVGGRFLLEAGWPEVVQAIYRVHPAPPDERLAHLARMTAALAAGRGLPDAFVWDRARTSLGAYLAALPVGGPTDGAARAIHRQAVLTNLRSSFTPVPGVHSGVGADPYARFSAPMREVVGVFVHGEALELLARQGARPSASADTLDAAADSELRDRVVSAAEAARQRQKRFDDHAHRIVLDRLFAKDLARPLGDRPSYRGVVLGLSSGKLHVGLDDPPLDVKVYFYDLAQALGGAWLEIAEADTALVSAKDRTVLFRVGDAVRITALDRARERDRWVLDARRAE